MVGQHIGSYRIVRLLGQGGMSAVYEGVHEQIGRRVAIKVLHDRLQEHPDLAARFIQEARATNQIQHPAIVAIHEYGQLPGGSAYLIMEYLEGETLERRLARMGGRLPQPVAISLARQVAGALAAAHARGIVHRDIKSPNIMIIPDPEMPGGERVKVLDFGIAKVAAEAEAGGLRTRTGVLMGTPHYMSPEQCRGAGLVDDRTDVYSLGVLIFEMISGRLPFEGNGPGELIAAHLGRTPPKLSEVAPWTAPELAALVEAMLRKVPAERPSMAEVVAALDRLRTGLTAPSGPEAPGALPPAAGVGANGAAASPLAIPSPPWGLAPSASSGSVSAPLPGALPSPVSHAPPVQEARPTPNRPLLQPRGEREEEREERAEARPTPNRPLLQPLLWLGAGLGLGLLVALGVLLRSGRGQQPPAPPAPPPPATAAASPPAAATQKSSEPASAEPVRRSAGRRSSHSSRGETPSDGGGPEGGSGEERPLRLSRNPLDQQLARLAAQVAPGQRQVGRLQAGYGRQGQEQHRYVDLSAGRCYTFVSVGAPPMEALYAYLWDPRGRRVATEKDSGRQPVVWHCAAMSGRYHFLVKAAGGDGEYRSAVFVR